jgi:hypothetical protein
VLSGASIRGRQVPVRRSREDRGEGGGGYQGRYDRGDGGGGRPYRGGGRDGGGGRPYRGKPYRRDDG